VLGQRHPHVLVDDLHLLPSPLLLPMLQSIVAPPDPSATSSTKTTLLATADPDPLQVDIPKTPVDSPSLHCNQSMS
jgi:hypothetical protein